eukprot:CAMPEP_0194371702 /NCGR_PEP_ID=MMETSP0174-20130528/20125_1 /TAXON_ID=216777 /ORGANISM="Proboscia alata, Strain PI-D3" /LENGTH=431 /DNA_ID=CAMNT_0039149909 /DNA_START=622 /DNA_END=1914 /DNA_ORIENTATION=-
MIIPQYNNGLVHRIPKETSHREERGGRSPRSGVGFSSWCSCLAWCCGPYKVPLLIVAAIYMMMSTGGAGIMWRQLRNVSNLERQLELMKEGNRQLGENLKNWNETVNEVHSQIDEVGFHVNKTQEQNTILAHSINTYQNITHELKQNNKEYASQNAVLNASYVYRTQLNANLSETVAYANNLTERLKGENGEYRILNKQLKHTVNKFESTIQRVEKSNKDLQNATKGLEIELDEISIANDVLRETTSTFNKTAQSLMVSVDNLTTQNEYHSALNKNMSKMLSFLNDTVVEMDESFENIIGYLDSQIYTNRMLVLKDLQLKTEKFVSEWRCMLNDGFADQSWVYDPWEPIAPVDPMFKKTLDYIDNVLLGKLCADVADFELYIQWQYPEVLYPDQITLSHITASVTKYTDLILGFYYSQNGENGEVITLDEW